MLPALLAAALVAAAWTPGARAATPEWRQRESFGVRGPGRGELREPVAAALLEDGDLAVLERDRGTVVVFDRRGRYQRTLGGGRGVGGFELRRPEGLAAAPDGNLWVADTGNHRLLVVAPDGAVAASHGSLGAGRGRFRGPRGVAFDRAGRAYVADTGNRRIQVLSARSGALLDSWDSRTGGRRDHLDRPAALAWTERGEGGLWVVDAGAGRRLDLFDRDGTWQRSLEVPEAVDGEVELAAVAVEPGLHRMFLADRAGGRVLVLDRKGGLRREVTVDDGALDPAGVAVSRSLELYVADRGGGRVVRFSVR